MAGFKYETLPTASPAEIPALVEAAFADGDPDYHLREFEKQMVPRALEALAMPSLRHICSLAVGETSVRDGVEATRVASPDPRWAMLALLGPTGKGVLLAVKARFQTNQSPKAAALIAEMMALETLEETGEERRDFSARIVAEMRAEDKVEARFAKEGWPADFPPLADATDFEDVEIHEFGRPLQEASGDAAAQIAAKRGCGPEAAKVAKAVSDGGYTNTAVAKSGRASNYGEGPFSVHAEIGRPFHWRHAFGLLRAALPGEVLAAVAARAAEVAGRTYRAYADEDSTQAIQRLAAAAAQLDGGLPGTEAAALEDELELRAMLLSLPRLAKGITRLKAAYAASAPDLEDGQRSYNDLDNSLHAVTDGGWHLMRIEDQNGHFLVLSREEDGGTRYGICRTGRDLKAYLDYHGSGQLAYALTPEALGSLEVHRQYANPADLLAPLPVAEAVERLKAEAPPFPGFMGCFTVSGEDAAWTVEPVLTLNMVKDVNTLRSAVGSGVIELEEDLARAKA